MASATPTAPMIPPSDQPAWSPEKIDRPPLDLEGHAVRVHGDVHQRVERGEDDHDRGQNERVGCQHREDRQEREDESCDGEHAPARRAHEQLAGDLLRDESTDGCAEQHEPHLCRVGPQARLDAGDGGHPGAHHRTVDHEEEERGDPWAHLPALNG